MLVATGALLALVAVVAEGSPLEAPAGNGELRVDVSALAIVVGLLGLGALAALVVAVWTLVGERGGRVAQRPRRTWLHLVASLVLVSLLLSLPREPPLPEEEARPPVTEAGPAAEQVPDTRPAPPMWPVVLIGATFVAAMAAAAASGRRRRPPSPAPTRAVADPEQARAAFDASLEELLAEPDPRRAVVAAYATLLTGLGRAGVPRRPSEAPEEHLERALVELQVPDPALRALVALFEEARFSTHALTETHKARALDALRTAQAELRREAAVS